MIKGLLTVAIICGITEAKRRSFSNLFDASFIEEKLITGPHDDYATLYDHPSIGYGVNSGFYAGNLKFDDPIFDNDD